MTVSSLNYSIHTLMECDLPFFIVVMVITYMWILRSSTSKEEWLWLGHWHHYSLLPAHNSFFSLDFYRHHLSTMKCWYINEIFDSKNDVLLGSWLCFLCRILCWYYFVITKLIFSHLQHLIIKNYSMDPFYFSTVLKTLHVRCI